MMNASKQRIRSGKHLWFRCLAWLTICLGGMNLRAESPIQNWTDIKGRSVEARFVNLTDQTVTLKRADGRIISLPLQRLDAISAAKAQALAAPEGTPAPSPEPAQADAAQANPVHGTSGKEVATLAFAHVSLAVQPNGDAYLTPKGGETFPIELSARVYVHEDGQKTRVHGKASAAPEVSDHEVILHHAFDEMDMELHYELDATGTCTVWYRFKNPKDREVQPSARASFPQLVSVDAGTDGFVKNRTEEALTDAQLRSWLGRKTIKMSGFKGHGSDKLSFTKATERDTSATFKSLNIDAGTYHDKAIRIDAPKSRNAELQFFMLGGLKPMNGFGLRLNHEADWERSDRSLGMTIRFK